MREITKTELAETFPSGGHIEILRGNKDAICKKCGKALEDHKMYTYPGYSSGYSYGPVLGCDGKFYHL